MLVQTIISINGVPPGCPAHGCNRCGMEIYVPKHRIVVGGFPGYFWLEYSLADVNQDSPLYYGFGKCLEIYWVLYGHVYRRIIKYSRCFS